MYFCLSIHKHNSAHCSISNATHEAFLVIVVAVYGLGVFTVFPTGELEEWAKI